MGPIKLLETPVDFVFEGERYVSWLVPLPYERLNATRAKPTGTGSSLDSIDPNLSYHEGIQHG